MTIYEKLRKIKTVKIKHSNQYWLMRKLDINAKRALSNKISATVWPVGYYRAQNYEKLIADSARMYVIPKLTIWPKLQVLFIQHLCVPQYLQF